MVEITRASDECPPDECPSHAQHSQKQLRQAAHRRLGQPVVLGVDPSLKATGLVAIPADFGGDWSRVAHRTVGYSIAAKSSDRARIERLERLGAAVVAFATEHDCTLASVEGFPFGVADAAFSLGEASGVIKTALHVAGLDVRTAPLSSARKALLGHVPRAGVKLAVRDRLVALGAIFPTLDCYDAAVCALYGLGQLGVWPFEEAT